jgi:hypothetical protein
MRHSPENTIPPKNMRWWFSGIITACHAVDRGSIPRQRNFLFFLDIIFSCLTSSIIGIFPIIDSRV